VDWLQLAFGAFLIVLLIGLTGYFGWQQLRALARLRAEELPLEERRHIRNQAWRRLFGCLLMAVFAGLLIGGYALDEPARELARQAKAAHDEGRPLPPEQQQFRKVYSYYWMTALLVLMVLLFTAAFDVWAIRRHGLRQFRQIQADRMAMLHEELTRLRTERNGHH
jgi:hypothetical protein